MRALSTATCFLFSRENCCLCEQAWQLLDSLQLTSICAYRNIDADLELLQLFGDKVPVLASADRQRYLVWPFDAQQVLAFVGEQTL